MMLVFDFFYVCVFTYGYAVYVQLNELKANIQISYLPIIICGKNLKCETQY